MSTIGSFRRIKKLLQVAHKYRLFDLSADRHMVVSALKITGFIFSPFSARCAKDTAAGVRLYQALTELGPIYIKFGQLLSTRRDLLPEEIANSLAKLQDNVDPFCGKQAREIVETAMGTSLSEHFELFDETPMASASIAQVHAARLKTKQEVIIKVLRPNIRTVIDKDLALLNQLANWLYQNFPQSHRFKPREVVRDYQHTILDELNLLLEAKNAQKLAGYWKGSDIFYVPDVYLDLCHEQVMVMERIYGVPVSDLETLHAAGTNMELLAERGVEIFFTQVFRDSFFHADMHPGNIFVDITDPQQPKYIGVDFGIMGWLSADDQRYLAENFLAFFNRDYYQVAKLHVDSGWVPPSTSVEEFQKSIEQVCEPIFGKPLSEISFGYFLINLFQTAQKFNMPVQPQLVLLQKTLLYIEGLGRQLYPQLDLWKTAKPFLENWLTERMSITNLIKELQDKAPYWREKFPEIPDLIYQSLKNDHKNQQILQHQADLLEQQNQAQAKQSKGLFYTILGSTLLICTTILFVQDNIWAVPETVTTIISALCFYMGRRNSSAN